MMDIYKKINISKLLIFIIFFSFISGLFKDILIFFMIIIIHEMGHIITSLFYGWKIRKISIGIIGGYITYDEVIDKPFKEEFLISISGFLSQLLFYTLFYILYKNNFISIKIFEMINRYNFSILLFNLIPIIPLDGSKILSIILNNFMSYKKTLKVLNFISIFLIILIIFIFISCNLKIEYSYIMILSFLFSNLITSIKDIPYLFNKFLFERYMYPINSNKYVFIRGKKIEKMKRQKKHYFVINDRCYKEKDILTKKFD